jgi:hypothetical protein
MRKTLVTLGLLASLVAPGAATAHADHYRDHGRRGYRHESPRYDYDRPYHRDRAWRIVRNDPCRWHEYQRFAAKHENPNKRRRVVEQLAREGCWRDRVAYRHRHHR